MYRPHTKTLVPFAAALLLVPALPAQDRVEALDAQALDWFGYDVASHGDLTLVGSWRDDDAGESTGSAHLVYTPGFGTPVYVRKLSVTDGAAGDMAGMAVAIGDGVLLVAAPGRVLTRGDGSTIVGTVVVFEDIAGVWTQVAELDDRSRTAGDLFGHSVAITDSGVLVGAPRDDGAAPDGGAVYAFERRPNGWVRTAKLHSFDCGTHDYFGHDVSADGGAAVVGAYNDDDRGTNAGAAYVLESAGGAWTVGQKLLAAEGAAFDSFGTSVAIHGDTIVVGAPQNEDTDPETVLNEGLAVVYERSPASDVWVETMVLRPGRPGAEHRFGIDVAVGPDQIVVGASHSDTALVNAGTAHVFARRGRDWFESERHVGTAPQAYAYLGLSVAVADNAVIVGVPGADGAAVGTGAIDVFPSVDTGTVWGSTYCHSNQTVEGFANMGGKRNADGVLGRLGPAGSTSYARGDLILRATHLEEGMLATLYVGTETADINLGGSRFCVASGVGGMYRFAYRAVGADRKYVVRDPIGKIEESFPGTGSLLVGLSIYAQCAYTSGGRRGRWLTTNALSFTLEP